MPPQESPVETPYHSSYGFKYPPHRDDPKLCSELWLQDKQVTDGAEGLWRIHNKLYDLTSWMDKHPGGRDWIRLTKGTDVTEAFESYHIYPDAEQILPKFYIREAKFPRNSPFTFHEDGFYRTLKRRVREPLKTIPKSRFNSSNVITDLLLIGFVFTASLAVVFKSLFIGAMSGTLLNLMAIASHNFFHQRDCFRMYYFDLFLLSYRDWRVSHAMSHHLYTNTINDLEISLLQPFLLYLPSKNSFWQRIISCIISPVVWTFLIPANIIKKYIFIFTGTIKDVNWKTELIPYSIPILMYFIGGQTIVYTFLMWLWIICVGSFYFGFMGFNAAHHHPELFHDGDTPRDNPDWGLFQLDAVIDRHEIKGSPFLVLVSFGDHVLHHLFPTVDHSKLHYLYPILQQTCDDFGVKYRVISQWMLIQGQYAQLLRMTPNPVPPGQKWKWYKTFGDDFKRNFWESVAWIVSKYKSD